MSIVSEALAPLLSNLKLWVSGLLVIAVGYLVVAWKISRSEHDRRGKRLRKEGAYLVAITVIAAWSYYALVKH